MENTETPEKIKLCALCAYVVIQIETNFKM